MHSLTPRLSLRAFAGALAVTCLVGCGLLLPNPMHAHGAFHDRLRELAAAVELRPAEARLHFELAEIFCRHGDWALAVASADTAEELKPGVYRTDLVRGEALLAGGKPEAARVALTRFLTREPAHAKALILRARATTALQGPAAALGEYRAVVGPEVRPELDAFREAAAALSSQGLHDEALQALDRAIALLGPDPALLSEALEIELAANRLEPALVRLSILQAAAPRPEPGMVRRAELLARFQRTAEARKAWADLLVHLENLPNLERGSRVNWDYASRAHAALAVLTEPTSRVADHD